MRCIYEQDSESYLIETCNQSVRRCWSASKWGICNQLTVPINVGGGWNKHQYLDWDVLDIIICESKLPVLQW